MHIPRLHAVWRYGALLAMIGTGCGKVAGNERPADAAMPAEAETDAAAVGEMVDAALIDGPPVAGMPGTKDNPARTCNELRLAGFASGVYWLSPPSGIGSPFEEYCEQTINGGGWVMVENSVLKTDGSTLPFWQFKYADRLKRFGTPAVNQNYYDGSLYVYGKEYMDIIVDLQNRTAVAVTLTVAGFNVTTMQFMSPSMPIGNSDVFKSAYDSGWSSSDYDNDAATTASCSQLYGNVAQHYNNCWSYNLGSDGDEPKADGGVGPHVHNNVLSALMLTPQTNGGVYSRVARIARFTRW
jgi:hypothetical protein